MPTVKLNPGGPRDRRPGGSSAGLPVRVSTAGRVRSWVAGSTGRGLMTTALLLVVPVSDLSAQTPEAVTLEEALRLFHERSPELALAREKLARELAEARQERALPNPSALVSTEDVGNYSEQYYNLTQRIDFLWTAGPKGRSADARQARARARFRADSARLVRELRSSWTRTVAAAERVDALWEAVGEVEELVADAGARFQEGDLSGYDLRRFRVALGGLTRRAGVAEAERREAEEQLGASVGGEAMRAAAVSAVGAPTGPPPLPDREIVLESSVIHRPELSEARAAVDVGRAQASLARGSLLRGTQVTGGFKQQSDDREGYYLELSIPLPILDRKGGAVEAAEASVRQAETTVQVVERIVVREASRAWARLRAAREVWSLVAEDGLEDGVDLLGIARVAYAEEEIGIEGMLDAIEVYLNARLAAVEVRADAWTAYHGLLWAGGGPGGPETEGGAR